MTIAMGQALFRNLVNVRLQQLVPDVVRASTVLLCNLWIGSPPSVRLRIGGALRTRPGRFDGGYRAIAAPAPLPSVLLYVLARRHGVWHSQNTEHVFNLSS